MKAILIDPFEQKVRKVDFTGDFRNIYEHIQCDMFTAVRLNKNNMLWVDDEGLLKDPITQRYFIIEGYDQPLAGRGLVLGSTPDGNSVGTKMTEYDVAMMVRFVRPIIAQ